MGRLEIVAPQRSWRLTFSSFGPGETEIGHRRRNL